MPKHIVEHNSASWLVPDWPAPKSVRAVTTTRAGGVSASPYASLNLGDHVGDVAEAVAENRARLQALLDLPVEPVWLNQVHGTDVVDIASAQEKPTADASVARQSHTVCSVLTADCLPVLFCDRQGTVVAAAHAGWRGLADGVLEATVRKMEVAPETLLAWLGPAIGPESFEVGDEVRQLFLAHDPLAEQAFKPSVSGRWLANLYQLARQRLNALGVHHIYGGDCCTFKDATRFYSYRRDGATGRMATLIWLTE